ncbi:nitroimidazole resistance protein [Mesoterricola silvestris]|uniref:Nitroimidazole resistance protein n=1 Tax=Mesoterricola silvestris TaxID=2927979 RepID=A0AA48KA54_9BACT|nr:nitroimidazole resistance protein [Mesoterricola silvestris]
MRRQEKELKDPEAVAEVLDGAEWGVLGLVSPQGAPILVPLNFVRLDGKVYFHGAHAGEKMEALRHHRQATFLVVDAYAQIPSYAFDPERACPASQYFRSVLLHGTLGEVEDPARKAAVLDALMRRLQPEGGYRPITAEDPMYAGSVGAVAILELTVERSSAKCEMGQRLTPAKRDSVRALLERRGTPTDLRTLEAMGAGPGSPGSGPEAPGAAPAS